MEALSKRVNELADSIARTAAIGLNRQMESLTRTVTQNLELQRQLEEFRHSMELAAVPALTQFHRAQEQLARNIARSISTPEMTSALRRIAEAAELRDETRAELERLIELRDSGELDEDAIGAVEAQVAADEDLTRAFDQAATQLRGRNPWMSHATARKVVVTLVYIISFAAQMALAVALPVVGSAPGALGLDSKTIAKAAGRSMDRLKKPGDENEELDDTDPLP